MDYGLVSVIMPAYNAEKSINNSIKSVIKQEYANLELIVINDGSFDDTVKIVKKYMLEDQRIKLIDRKKNMGIAYSRNEGLECAKGNYIAFLDSDDVWYKDKLRYQLQKMNEEDIEFCCTSYNIDDGIKVKEYKKQEGYYTYNNLLSGNIVGCLTVVISSRLAKKYKFPGIKHEDYAYWLKLLSEEKIELFFLDKILSCYKKTNTSVSSNKIKSIVWALRVIESQKKLNIVKIKMYQLMYLFNTLFKYIL